MARTTWLLLVLFSLTALLEGQVPHLAGGVTVIPPEGVLEGSVCLTNFAARRTLRFLLGAPLNIKSVSAGSGPALDYDGDYDGRMIGEAREYVLRRPDSLPPFESLCVTYRGAVPVFETNSATSDWKGRIVATNGTLRAAEQSRWYPTLFDSTTGRNEEAVTYNLTIQCRSCRSLYVNGSPPVAGGSGVFASATPRALLLYAGDFGFQSDSAMTLVGGSASARTVETFNQAIRGIGDYYGALLGVPYGERPVLLSFRSVSRDHQLGIVNWQFVTWPTITFSGGLDFDQLVEERAGQQRLPDWLWGSLSHEMAHYYFGTLRQPVGPLRWFVLESTAEYLSLTSVAHMRGDDVLATRELLYLNAVETAECPPLRAITDPDQLSSLCRYYFEPVALLSLDHRVGEGKVMRMLRALLDAPAPESADYAELERAAAIAGISPEELARPVTTATLRAEALAVAGRAMADLIARSDDAGAVALATVLVDVDTSLAERLEMMRVLRGIARRDPTNLAVEYQVGRIGALTGQELVAAQRALELVVRSPAAPGNPSPALAYWRLGAIAEHRGDTGRARALYRSSLELDSTNVAVAQALARLGGSTTPR